MNVLFQFFEKIQEKKPSHLVFFLLQRTSRLNRSRTETSPPGFLLRTPLPYHTHATSSDFFSSAACAASTTVL